MLFESDFENRIKHRLIELKESGLKRELREPSGVDLSSNDFLSLSKHPLVKARMAEAVLKEGTGSTASRLLRGHRQKFTEVERRFAHFKQSEQSLYFGSGYAANIAVLSTFPEKGDVVFSDRLNHASIIDGIRLSAAERKIFDHCDVDNLRELLIKDESTGQRFIVTESLFGMDGDKAPLKEYEELCKETGAVLIVDEAHAVGIFGESGSGLIEALGLDHTNIISINPAGKALGVGGAFVAGSEWMIDYLIQRGRTFIFSTAPPPAMADALLASLEIMTNEPHRRRKVSDAARLLRKLISEIGFDVEQSDSPIIPIIIGENDQAVAVATELQSLGFDVRAIRPPTVPPGTARLRISVHCDLTEDTVRSFVDALKLATANLENRSCSVAYS